VKDGAMVGANVGRKDGSYEGVIVGEPDGKSEGVVVGEVDGLTVGVNVHACAFGELRKISVGVVMIFPIQKTHFSERITAKAFGPIAVTVDGIVTVTTPASRNIDLPKIERPLIRDIRVREDKYAKAKSPTDLIVDGIVTVKRPELWNIP